MHTHAHTHRERERSINLSGAQMSFTDKPKRLTRVTDAEWDVSQGETLGKAIICFSTAKTLDYIGCLYLCNATLSKDTGLEADKHLSLNAICILYFIL